jgi:hypothetical protein
VGFQIQANMSGDSIRDLNRTLEKESVRLFVGRCQKETQYAACSGETDDEEIAMGCDPLRLGEAQHGSAIQPAWVKSRSSTLALARRRACWVQIFMQQPRLAHVSIREAIRPASSDT